MTWGGKQEHRGEVLYKFGELHMTNRLVFENMLGNNIARIEGYPPFFLSKEDYIKLWPENPHHMSEKGYTIVATLQAKTLRFGGVAKAKVISTENINALPKISK